MQKLGAFTRCVSAPLVIDGSEPRVSHQNRKLTFINASLYGNEDAGGLCC